MEPVRPAAARQDTAGEFIDDQDLPVPDHVIDVALVERVGAQRLLDAVEEIDVVELIEVVHADQFFGFRHPLFGEHGRARLLVHEVVARGRLVSVLVRLLLALYEARDHAVALVVDVRVLFRGAGDDERGPRFVDEDRVDLVHDGVHVPALDHRLDLELHVVAQVVEAELVVRAVRDVTRVGRLALVVEQAVLNAADRQTEEAVDAAHPVGVAAGEVVVDRDDVHAPAGERVQIDGHRGDERLALARLHLGDLALVKDHSADQLNVERTHPERSHGSLPHDREGLLQDLVQDRRPRRLLLLLVFRRLGHRVGDARPKLVRLSAQIRVGEGLNGGLELVDPPHPRRQLLDVALVLGAKDLGEDAVDHI